MSYTSWLPQLTCGIQRLQNVPHHWFLLPWTFLRCSWDPDTNLLVVFRHPLVSFGTPPPGYMNFAGPQLVFLRKLCWIRLGRHMPCSSILPQPECQHFIGHMTDRGFCYTSSVWCILIGLIHSQSFLHFFPKLRHCSKNSCSSLGTWCTCTDWLDTASSAVMYGTRHIFYGLELKYDGPDVP